MNLTTVNLGAEAAAEAGRLARARTVIRHGDRAALDRLEADAIWVSTPRRRHLRRALGRRRCLIWRAAFEDASGRTVESHLVTVLVDVADAVPPSWLLDVADAVRVRVEGELEGWRASVLHVSAAFFATRSARERAVAAAARIADAPSQPGLFDRRVERARERRADIAAADERAFAERRERAAAARDLIHIPPRLLLVLVP